MNELKFGVALANKYKGKSLSKGKWLISRKYDGIRCIVFVDTEKREVKAYTRSCHQLHTTGKLTKLLEDHMDEFNESFVLDGELVSIDDDGNENFSKIAGDHRRKDYTIEQPMLLTFDMINMKEFMNGTSRDTLTKRLSNLKQTIGDRYKFIRIIEQVEMDNDERLETMINTGRENGWEGVMIRKDAKYKGKRSSDLLKVKDMEDAEFKVVSIQRGTGKYKNSLGNVTIEYNGNSVNVGSGFTDEQRDHYYKNPNKIMGKMITVQYFQKTKKSLRHPVFKGIREDL